MLKKLLSLFKREPRERKADSTREIKIGVIGTSGSGKSSLAVTWYEWYEEDPTQFQVAHLKPRRELSQILASKVIPPNTDSMVVFEGELRTGERVIVFDPLGGRLFEDDVSQPPTAPADDKAVAGSSPAAKSWRENLYDMSRQCDLLILALAPEDFVSSRLNNIIFRFVDHVHELRKHKPTARIAIAFTKADNYGVVDPDQMRLISKPEHFEALEQLRDSVSKSLDGADLSDPFETAWEGFLRCVTTQSKSGPAWDDLRRTLLSKTKAIWKQALDPLNGRLAINAYFVAARPMDTLFGYIDRSGPTSAGAVSGSAARPAQWVRRGVIQIFTDFLYRRPVSFVLPTVGLIVIALVVMLLAFRATIALKRGKELKSLTSATALEIPSQEFVNTSFSHVKPELATLATAWRYTNALQTFLQKLGTNLAKTLPSAEYVLPDLAILGSTTNAGKEWELKVRRRQSLPIDRRIDKETREFSRLLDLIKAKPVVFTKEGEERRADELQNIALEFADQPHRSLIRLDDEGPADALGFSILYALDADAGRCTNNLSVVNALTKVKAAVFPGVLFASLKHLTYYQQRLPSTGKVQLEGVACKTSLINLELITATKQHVTQPISESPTSFDANGSLISFSVQKTKDDRAGKFRIAFEAIETSKIAPKATNAAPWLPAVILGFKNDDKELRVKTFDGKQAPEEISSIVKATFINCHIADQYLPQEKPSP